MNVYWLEQNEADVPVENDWLSECDHARLSTMRFEKRRADFRLGRWTAKRALAAYLDFPARRSVFAEIDIRPEPSGAPEVFLSGKPADLTISLSHRAGTAICAIAGPGVALGCDLEIIEPRSDAFLTDYFTDEEQEFVTGHDPELRSQVLALLWSAKESALKAVREGLRINTRTLRAEPQFGTHTNTCGTWHPLEVSVGPTQHFQGWWQFSGDVLSTMVAAPSPLQPIPLLTAQLT